VGDIIAVESSITRENEWDSIITASRGERGARTWSWKGKAVGRHIFHTGDKSAVTSVSVSYCGNFGVVGSERGGVEVFNMQSGMIRKRYSLDRG
jgi:U3 small nucleolar RNA-associated protein 21